MKKELILTLSLFLLLIPFAIAPNSDEITQSGEVEKITLEIKNSNEIKWEVEGYSEQGFKVVWSKNKNPTYPNREGDRYHYYTEPERNEDELDAFDGAGTYYVRVCEYLGGKCGVYSNEVKIQLGEVENECDDSIENECIENEDSKIDEVEKITLEIKNSNEIKWEVEGYSEQGFKVVWSKNKNPTYPNREGDRYHYYTEPERNEDELDAFDGKGTYYVRVCEYLGGKCGVYSNEVEMQLGGEAKEEIYDKTCEELDGETCEVGYACSENTKFTIDGKYCCLGECKEVENTYQEMNCNNGCIKDEVCYPLGHRISGQFCSNNLTLIDQYKDDEVCENNFECKSNVCVSGECISQGLIQKILNWLKSFFG